MPSKKPARRSLNRVQPYDAMLHGVVELLESARRSAARSVNAVMTATYWLIGERIVEEEQHGAERADYGDELVSRLSADLTARFGRGFSRSNLFQMKAFYLAYGELGAAGARSPSPRGQKKVQTLSGQSGRGRSLAERVARFPLPWSHYVRQHDIEQEPVEAMCSLLNL
jgi:hypothetical protein